MMHFHNLAPQLLVSVRDAAEAEDAVIGGADWIDLKEPDAGPLGCVNHATAREISTKVANRKRITAAAGELVLWPGGPAQKLLEVREIARLKVGLAGCLGTSGWRRTIREIHHHDVTSGKRLVLAAYADWMSARAPNPDTVLQSAASLALDYILLDSWDKAGPALPNLWSAKQLAQFLRDARGAGLQTVVAGGISQDRLLELPLRWVDVVGVRGAACDQGRRGRVTAARVRSLRRLIDGAHAANQSGSASC